MTGIFEDFLNMVSLLLLSPLPSPDLFFIIAALPVTKDFDLFDHNRTI